MPIKQIRLLKNQHSELPNEQQFESGHLPTANFRLKRVSLKKANGTISLKKTNGDVITVPLARLSETDRDFINKIK